MLLRAVIRVAKQDGISAKEVISRGVDDLALRLAYDLLLIEESEKRHVEWRQD